MPPGGFSPAEDNHCDSRHCNAGADDQAAAGPFVAIQEAYEEGVNQGRCGGDEGDIGRRRIDQRRVFRHEIDGAATDSAEEEQQLMAQIFKFQVTETEA